MNKDNFFLSLGNLEDVWSNAVSFLDSLQDPNNVVKVLHDPEGEVTAIFVQLEKQRKLYKMYGKVVEVDGTYNIEQAGFALYHLLIEDNNGDGQPVALFFIREETTEAISECLRIFAEVMNVLITFEVILIIKLNCTYRITTSRLQK